MPTRRPSAKPLRRRRPQKDERPRFVIFCEGTVTEPVYLNAFAALPEIRRVAALDVRGMGYDPHRLVAEAKQARRSEPGARESRTEYWCVFDVEAPEPHQGLRDAVQMARDNGIGVAVSNPCFELWLILHHAEHTRWLDTEEAQSLRRHSDGSTGKGLDTVEYMQRRKTAAGRARQLAEMHERDGSSFPGDNPSSGIFRLLEAVEQAPRQHGGPAKPSPSHGLE
ncbi:RloB family protein [Candidatus Poriferisodalis sp.]|uniref:RloB family protein n=1 Tax=Candidatus Poriferisodalis sp. TaxID=3101277 RepID=UPI003B028DC4